MISLEGSVIGISSFSTHIGMYVRIILCSVCMCTHKCTSVCFTAAWLVMILFAFYRNLILVIKGRLVPIKRPLKSALKKSVGPHIFAVCVSLFMCNLFVLRPIQLAFSLEAISLALRK